MKPGTRAMMISRLSTERRRGYPYDDYDRHPGTRPGMNGGYRRETYPREMRSEGNYERYGRGYDYPDTESRSIGYDRMDGGDWDPRMMGRERRRPEKMYAAGAVWSDYQDDRRHERGRDHQYRAVDEQMAMNWVKRMENADGSQGPHYKIEQVEQWRSTNCMDCEKWPFFVAVNMMYSDYCKTAEKMGISKIDFYGSMARDFLNDPDAGPYKLQKYLEQIPK